MAKQAGGMNFIFIIPKKQMNKKAQADAILVTWSLIAFVVVFTILLGYIWNFNNNHMFEKRFLVRDLSLVTEASQSGVGDFIYKYPLNFSSYGKKIETKLDISNNIVKLSGVNGIPTEYWFSNTTTYKISYSENKGDYFYIIKNDEDIRLIRGEENINMLNYNIRVCNIIDPLKIIWPVNSPTVTSHFGFRKNPVTRNYEIHPGVDIVSTSGDTSILAAASGTVVAVKNTCIKSRSSCNTWAEGYGNYIEIDHGKNKEGEHFETFYAHLKDVKVSDGNTVTKGQVIGTMGSTGLSTGPHLHFEFRFGKDGKTEEKCNPENFLKPSK